jgi:hypothetical protein
MDRIFCGDLSTAASRIESAVISFNIPARTVSSIDQQLVNPQPSLKPRSVAGSAPRALKSCASGGNVILLVLKTSTSSTVGARGAALGANASAQPLGQHAFQRAGHHEPGMPMSTNRVTVDGASLVWMVENTKWPVMAASMAMWAVSWSRISPTMMTSGSNRKKTAGPWQNQNTLSSPIRRSGLT